MEEIIENLLLTAVERAEIENTLNWAAGNNLAHLDVVGCVKSLENDSHVVSKIHILEKYELTQEAVSYELLGSPEMQLFKQIAENGAEEKVLKEHFGEPFFSIAKGKCMQKKWISFDKASAKLNKIIVSDLDFFYINSLF